MSFRYCWEMVGSAARKLGAFGEAVAAEFIEERGLHIIGRNVFVHRDEIDLIYRTAEGLVAVEVKTVSDGAEPFTALTEEKMRRLRRAVAGYGDHIVGIDAIGIVVGDDGVEVRWLRGIG